MPEIKFEITSCRQCPFFESRRMRTDDSWEFAFNWYCKKMNGKEIAGYIEWESEAKAVKIPEWCPIKVKE
jgi:hypothetical protein